MAKVLLVVLVAVGVVFAWIKYETGYKGILGDNTTYEPVSAVVKVRSDQQAIIVDFRHRSFVNVSTVSYNFTYVGGTPKVSRGVSGNFVPDPTEYTNQLIQGAHYVERQMVMGTCSKGVCVYDANPTSLRLEVTTTMSSGLKYYQAVPLVFPRS